MTAKITAQLVENATAKVLADASPRGHLGASQLGDSCRRKVWYSFRWAQFEDFSGRMLRLFNRGHTEESRLIRWLEMAGFRVQDSDPATGKQFNFSDPDTLDHFRGSADGICDALPDCPNRPGPFLLEIKTCNDKNFRSVAAQGVMRAKPVHYAQMQIYMHFFNLPAGLYCAVNKNDDTLHFELVDAAPHIAARYRETAKDIVFSELPPPRESNSPAWWRCRFCPFSAICHENAAPLRNCRTCQHSRPAPQGQWTCALFGPIPDKTAQAAACVNYALRAM